MSQDFQSDHQHSPSQYTVLSMNYNHSEFHSVQKLLRSLASSAPYNTRYPILKLLKAVCRRLLINEFESVFFAYVVRANRWNINDDIVRKHLSGVRDIVCYSADDEDYKGLTLYLLLCGYTVKFYLNEHTDMYTAEMEKACPDFKQVFEEWAKHYAWTTLRIHPKNLNTIYKQISLKPEPRNVQADYNCLVDQLLQISPSYNPEKEKVDTSTLKKEYADFREVKKENQSKIKMSESVANLSILCSSGFLQQINPGNGSSTFNTSLLAKKKVTIASSVFGLPPNVPVED